MLGAKTRATREIHMSNANVSRREFVRRSAIGLGAFALPRSITRLGERAPQKIIIVGAGMAGLGAAFELIALGHDVTILEARTRPGGSLNDTVRCTQGARMAIGSHAAAIPV